MQTTIQKWGNSLGVRLPKGITSNKSFKEGSRVLVTETKTGLAIEIVERPVVKLNELLRGVTKKNLHKEIVWSNPVGKEVW